MPVDVKTVIEMKQMADRLGMDFASYFGDLDLDTSSFSSIYSATLNYTVDKTSAGALEYLPVARVSNLPACMEELKARGVWIYGTDMEGEVWCQTDLTGPMALVVGNEGKGMGRLVREKCDFILSLPMSGNIQSLNASVAAGIVMYEVHRQRKIG